MRERIERAAAVGRAVVREAREENLPFMAGSIAYHAFVSLLPFFVLALVLARTAGTTDPAAVAAFAEGYLTPNTRSVLTDAARRAARRTGLSGVGVVLLLWGALKIFRSLDQAFSNIYETGSNDGFLDQLTDGVVVLVAVSAAVLAVAAAGTLVTLPDAIALVVRLPAVLAGVTLAFLPLYYVFPDEDVALLEVLPGAVLAAVGWTAVQRAFHLYLEYAPKSETYGLVGAVVAVLTWLYATGLVVLVGASLNAVLAGRTEDVEAAVWDATPDAHSGPELAASLRDVEDAFDDTSGFSVTSGDTTTDLPPPDDLAHTTDDDGTVRLTVEWD